MTQTVEERYMEVSEYAPCYVENETRSIPWTDQLSGVVHQALAMVSDMFGRMEGSTRHSRMLSFYTFRLVCASLLALSAFVMPRVVLVTLLFTMLVVPQIVAPIYKRF